MYDVSRAIEKAYRPFDIFSLPSGEVGYIKEVSINHCQEDINHQLSYSVEWLVGTGKTAWWDHEELTVHCNMFVKIAENASHNMGQNQQHVDRLLGGKTRR